MEFSAGHVRHQFIELVPFNGNAKLQRMKTSHQKRVIIPLKRIPSEKRRTSHAQTSLELVNARHHKSGSIVSRHSGEGSVIDGWIDRLYGVETIGEIAIKAKSQRIDQRGAEDVVLSENQDLTLG